MRTIFDHGDYSTGIFACASDLPTCAAVCCCSCLATGRLVGRMNDQDFSVPACICPIVGMYRARRGVQSLHVNKESEDTTTIAAGLPIVNCCALCQDYREWDHFSEGGVMPNSSSSVPPPAVETPASE